MSELFADFLTGFVRVLDTLNGYAAALGGVLWHDWVLYVILAVGVLFTLWSGFCQYRALTHGTAITMGKYDDKDDPGAINHFQALSAALSATVGIGNIGGVAGAIALGGPGAVFWMWVVGFVGMALKTTEVSLAMLYRNTDDPDNPHGGAMWVADRGFAQQYPRLWWLGKILAVLFCVTLLISTVTGGNMFQAWNVAEVTKHSFGVPRLTCGLVLAALCGLVIIGGIKSIGRVAGYLVPFMCLIYIAAGLAVLALNAGAIPGIFAMIFEHAFAPATAGGAFVGGSVGAAFSWGLKRSLFSSESGQGSAPIAHSAAKTDEPIREGLVAGLEPFIDTLIVCTLTALVVLSSGAWNRGAEAQLPAAELRPAVHVAEREGDGGEPVWELSVDRVALPPRQERLWDDAGWEQNLGVFLLVRGHDDPETNDRLHRLEGKVAHAGGDRYEVVWTPKTFRSRPELVEEDGRHPVYVNYLGAALTSHAFDRLWPGLGWWMVPVAVWLFALSTVISWSYYGEQGMVYLFGNWSVHPYRVLYCVCIIVATLGIVTTEDELAAWTDLGTGVMLWANLPICLIFGATTMRAYHSYIRRWKAGETDRRG